MKLSGNMKAIEFDDNELTSKKERIYRYNVFKDKSNYKMILYTPDKTISLDISNLVKELYNNLRRH